MVIDWFIREERDKGSGLDPATGEIAQWFHGEEPDFRVCLPPSPHIFPHNDIKLSWILHHTQLAFHFAAVEWFVCFTV